MWRFYSQPVTYAGRRYYLSGPTSLAHDQLMPWTADVEIEASGMELNARVDDSRAPTFFEISSVGYNAHGVSWLVQLWVLTILMFGGSTAMLAYGAVAQSLIIEIVGAVFVVAALCGFAVVVGLNRRDAERYAIGALLPARHVDC